MFFSSDPQFCSTGDGEAAGPRDTKILNTDSETVAMINGLLNDMVNVYLTIRRTRLLRLEIYISVIEGWQ